MRVLLTGGTGFVGSHTAAALVAAGHDVRLLARDPARVAPALAPHRIDVEIAVGDMVDEPAVREAVAGCDVVIHAAAEIGIDTRTPAGPTNLAGVRTVIGAALGAGVRHVIYTSSVTVHLPSADPVVTTTSPLAVPLSSYGESKRDAELAVRAWQDDGAPISVVVLGGVYGPVAPHRGSSFQALLGALSSLMLVPPGGSGVIDVRDAAALLAHLTSLEGAPRRYLAGGRFVTWHEWTDLLTEAVGREVGRQIVTEEELRSLGREFDDQRAAGVDLGPLSEEAAIIMTTGAPTDDVATQAELGRQWRPTAHTFADTIAYLRSTGEVR